MSNIHAAATQLYPYIDHNTTNHTQHAQFLLGFPDLLDAGADLVSTADLGSAVSTDFGRFEVETTEVL